MNAMANNLVRIYDAMLAENDERIRHTRTRIDIQRETKAIILEMLIEDRQKILNDRNECLRMRLK